MSLLNTPFLAQANAAIDDPTPGQVFSGMLVLLVMAASMAMIIVWIVRLRQSGHALPAARRGVLRVPLPLTMVAIALSLLMLLLMFVVSIEDQIIPPPVAAAPVTAVAAESPADESQAEPAVLNDLVDSSKSTSDLSAADLPAGSAESKSKDEETASADPLIKDKDADAAPPASTEMTPERMKSALLQTVVMDLVLFFVFGFIVFLSNASGRVLLPDSIAVGAVAAAENHENSSPFPSNSFWPDLNDASAIPQRPDFGVLGEPSISSPSPERFSPGDSYYDPSRGESFHAFADEPQDSAGEPDEVFSFMTELWYAGEVFLAAYVPTTFLRILVVLLTIGLLGEEPAQHPFLEMMNTGIGVTLLSLILLTAVFFAPIVEELQFRVVILGGIAQVGRPMLALSISSILFAFAHGFPDSLALLPLAFALGYTYLRRRSYITVMLVHFLFNGFNMVLALLAML